MRIRIDTRKLTGDELRRLAIMRKELGQRIADRWFVLWLEEKRTNGHTDPEPSRLSTDAGVYSSSGSRP